MTKTHPAARTNGADTGTTAELPRFREVPVAYKHNYVRKSHAAHEMLDVAVGDLNNDGAPVTLVSGGNGQKNGAFVIDDGRARDVTAELGLGGADEPTYGLAIADIDGDGLLEVISGQQSGLYVFSRDRIGEPFTSTRLDVAIPSGATPVSIAVADSNKNGHLDIFVSTFIEPAKFTRSDFNTLEVRNLNMLLINNGDGTFTDSTVSAGLTLSQNTFQAVFTDLTGDGFPDIALALNTDRVIAYRNNGDGTFTEHILHGAYGFWMGIAAGDTTGNGLTDLFLTNVGKSVPTFMLKGDATKDQPVNTDFVLLQNEGDFVFHEVAAERGADTNVFGWGAVIADFNGDGRNDIAITENFVGMPMNMHAWLPTAGKLLLQGTDGKFRAVHKKVGVANKNFGYRAVAADLTGTGTTDLILGNLNGPLRIFLNDANK